MYLFCVYIPISHLEFVKEALFKTGAGRVGHYSKCCWQVLGKGQFQPEEGSNPFVGEKGKVEVCEEYRVEMVCTKEQIPALVQALKEAHPYECPAYGFVKLEDF